MPMYEYYCSTCRERFENLVRVAGEGAHATCPSCGRTNVPRVLSTIARVRGGTDGAAQPAMVGGGGGCCGGGCGCG